MPDALEQILEQNGQPIPARQSATMLLDTGAGGTMIDPSVLKPLRLAPMGTERIFVPNSKTHQNINTFQVGIEFCDPSNDRTLVHEVYVIEGNLKNQGIDGLLGRDILKHGKLIYEGRENTFTLSF